MTVETGSRLGPYIVADQLGAGGMGEVYRATDSRLEREVAIKVLPDRVAEDPESLRRFRREAKAVSSLNHPHVCTLHDVGEQDGLHYLVMELVEGETLASRLARGPLPLDQALRIAQQVAAALATAHRAGLIHRDLKPGNIMLTKSGAKVLDFGLAKLSPGAGPASSVAAETRAGGAGGPARAPGSVPTMADPVTAEGTILGTLGYMAPEQLEGKDADARSDTFALGVVIYEMVTGKRAFRGESQASLMAAVLRDEPQPMEEAQVVTPPALERVVRRCLAKDPDERWQSALDLQAALGWAAEGPEAQAESRGRRFGWWPLVLGAAGLAVASAYLGSKLTAEAPLEPPEASVTRFTIDLPEGLGLGHPDAVAAGRPVLPSFAISPDGQEVFFTGHPEQGGESRLFRHSLRRDLTEPISGTEGAGAPWVAPDGAALYFQAGSDIRSTDLSEGHVRTLGPLPGRLQVSSAAVGSKRALVPWPGPALAAVPLTGGEPAVLISNTDEQCSELVFPQWLPGERAVLYNEVRGPRPSDWTVVARSLDTQERVVVAEKGSAPLYVESGHVLFARQGRAWAVPFDAEQLKVTGETVVVIDDLMHAENAGNTASELGSAQYAVSRSGTLVHLPGGVYPTRQSPLAWIDRRGGITTLPLPRPGYAAWARFSPDGKRVAYTFGESQYSSEVWILDVARGLSAPLNAALPNPGSLTWSPDGRELLVSSRRGSEGQHRVALDGSAPIRSHAFGGSVASWSPKGVVALARGGSVLVWDPNAADEPRRLFDTQGHWVGHPDFSPDGEWIAYTSKETGASEVFIRPASGGRPALRVSTAGGVAPFWSRDGSRLHFTSGNAVMVVDVAVEEGRLTVGTERSFLDLSEVKLRATVPIRAHDLSPVDERLIAPLRAARSDEGVSQLHVTLNWFEELQRLAPEWEE